MKEENLTTIRHKNVYVDYSQAFHRTVYTKKLFIISLKLNTPVTIISSEDRRYEGRTSNTVI